MPRAITLGATWHVSEGPAPMFLCTELKRDEWELIALTALRHSHMQHVTNRMLGNEGHQATAMCQAAQQLLLDSSAEKVPRLFNFIPNS